MRERKILWQRVRNDLACWKCIKHFSFEYRREKILYFSNVLFCFMTFVYLSLYLSISISLSIYIYFSNPLSILSLPFSLSLSLYIYIYIYIWREREKERERETDRGTEIQRQIQKDSERWTEMIIESDIYL